MPKSPVKTSIGISVFVITLMLLVLSPSKATATIPRQGNSITLEPGGQGTVSVTCVNTGELDGSVVALVVEPPSGITVSPDRIDLGSLPPQGSREASFTVNVAWNAQPDSYTLVLRCVATYASGPPLKSERTWIIHVPEHNPESGSLFHCFIATATYGSSAAPELMFLREFRDRNVLSTFSGQSFMIAFNAFYYSFSPQVASLIVSNAFLKEVMQFTLRPLLAILWFAQSVYLHVYPFDSETAIMLSGLVASSLIGLVYFAPVPALLGWRSRTLRRIFSSSRLIRVDIMVLSSLIGTAILTSLLRFVWLAPITTFVTSAAIMLYSALLPTLLWFKFKHL